MGKEQKSPGIIERLDDTLLFLSEETKNKAGLINQAGINAQIHNIILIKKSVSRSDCFHCWQCIKDFIQNIKSAVWLLSIFKKKVDG